MPDFFEKLFMAILFTLRIFYRNLLICFFMSVNWVLNYGPTSIHYLLDYGDCNEPLNFNQRNFYREKHQFLFNYIYTYIHNWPLLSFSLGYDLASGTTHVVCINFISEWRDLQFNIDSERQVLFTLRVFTRNLLRGNLRKNIFFFIFLFDA